MGRAVRNEGVYLDPRFKVSKIIYPDKLHGYTSFSFLPYHYIVFHQTLLPLNSFLMFGILYHKLRNIRSTRSRNAKYSPLKSKIECY